MVEVVEVFPGEEEEVVEVVVSRNCINEIALTQIDYQLHHWTIIFLENKLING